MGLITEVVSVENLSNGQCLQELNELFTSVLKDVIERPRVEAARKVSLVLTVTPNFNSDTGLNYPDIKFETKQSLPGTKGSTVRAIVSDGKVMVNLFDPNPDQHTLDFMEAAAARDAEKDKNK